MKTVFATTTAPGHVNPMLAADAARRHPVRTSITTGITYVLAHGREFRLIDTCSEILRAIDEVSQNSAGSIGVKKVNEKLIYSP